METKVVQQDVKSDLETRVEQIKKKLYKHLESENNAKNKSVSAEIRTQDLKRKSNVISITRQKSWRDTFMTYYLRDSEKIME